MKCKNNRPSGKTLEVAPLELGTEMADDFF